MHNHAHVHTYRYFMLFTLSVLQVHYLPANLLQLCKIFCVPKTNHYLLSFFPLSHSLSISLLILQILTLSWALSLSLFLLDDFFNPLLQLALSCCKNCAISVSPNFVRCLYSVVSEMKIVYIFGKLLRSM